MEDNSFRKLKKRFVESYQNPDFILRDKKTKKEIAIECKYLTKIPEEKAFYWAENYQIENYQKFMEQRKIPVYIIIGIGGRPNNPKELYRVPLSKLKYRRVKMDYLKYFKKNSKNFELRGDLLD